MARYCQNECGSGLWWNEINYCAYCRFTTIKCQKCQIEILVDRESVHFSRVSTCETCKNKKNQPVHSNNMYNILSTLDSQ